MKSWAILSDLQISYHDPVVVNTALSFVEQLKPDGVILNGDVVDCYSISKFNHDPLQPETLDREIKQAGKIMDRLSKCGAKELWWLGGNHEDRLRKYVWSNSEMFKLSTGLLDHVRFPSLFNLQHYGFRWKDYGKGVWLGKLFVTHGSIVRKHSAETARAHFAKYGVSVLVGHTHRLGAYYHTDMGGPSVAYENGCLCRLDPEYEQHPDWQHGFSIAHVDPVTKRFHVDQIPILRRTMIIYGGKKYVY